MNKVKMMKSEAVHPILLEDLIILRDLLSDLEELAFENLLAPLSKQIETLAARLEDEHRLRMGAFHLNVLFIGEASAGKSTLINTLLGASISPHHPVECLPLISELKEPVKLGFLKRVFSWFRKLKQQKELPYMLVDRAGVTPLSLHLHYAPNYQATIKLDNDKELKLVGDDFPSLSSLGTAVLQHIASAKMIRIGVPDVSLLDLELIDTPPLSRAQSTVSALMKETALPILVIRADEAPPVSEWRSLLQQRKSWHQRPPVIVITHTDKLTTERVGKLKSEYQTLSPLIFDYDLRSVKKERPFDRGQQWRSMLDEIKIDLLSTEEPLQFEVHHQIEGFDFLKYIQNNEERELLIPTKHESLLAPLLGVFERLKDEKGQVAAAMTQEIIDGHIQELKRYAHNLNQALDNESQQLTLYDEATLMQNLAPALSESLQRDYFKEYIRDFLDIRNLTPSEKSYWITPYAGVVFRNMTYAFSPQNLKKLFTPSPVSQAHSVLRNLAPSTSGDALNQELFSRCFNNFDQKRLEMVRVALLGEGFDQDEYILKNYEDFDTAQALGEEYIKEYLETCTNTVYDLVNAHYLEVCEEYAAGLFALHKSVYEHHLERLEAVKEKIKCLSVF